MTWAATPSGEDWFIHFQDKGVYGRVVHLQPMKWVNDWPVIGLDKDGDGKGEPVKEFKKPNVGKAPIATPADSDEFNGNEFGLQWQWQANPKATWSFMSGSFLRLYSQAIPEEAKGARVLGQMPDPGTLIAKNAPIQIHISAKAEYAERIKVPDLRGLTLEEAKAKLESVHLVLGRTETVRSVSPKPSGPPTSSTLEHPLESS